MTGDFTRNTFRPGEDFSLVRMQQGRVLTDADWNEQGDIARHLDRLTRTDVIGASGFPQDDAGFGLLPVGADVAILPGRGYVDGTLVRAAHGDTVMLERLSGAGADTLFRVAAGPVLHVGQRLMADGTPPEKSFAVTEVETDDDGTAIRLSEDLGAETATLTTLTTLAIQPHLPEGAVADGTGPYLAYLDVWDRQIFALEDPYLREVALGGPDTAGRDRTIWQVRLLPLEPLIEAGEIPAPPSCKSFPSGWSPHPDAPVRMAARAQAASAETDPCALPAAGGLRSFKNRLYRPEIHNGGVIGTDTVSVKWSTDNAMYRARLLEVSDGALLVDDAGKDDATGFKTGDWLEVLDEQRILDARPGFFVKLAEVVGERLGVAEILDPDTLSPLIEDDKPDTDKLPSQGQVRRWEGGAPVAVEAGWMPLDEGLEIRFADGGRAATGDHWTIPGRTIPADIEWPKDPSAGTPLELPPEGTRHAYCALAILDFDGEAWALADDCRHLFPPLTGLETFHYLGGDGQQVMPDLTQPDQFRPFPGELTVGVTRGRTPVAGRLVRFRTRVGDGSVRLDVQNGSAVSETGAEALIRTDEEGLASVTVSARPARPAFQVEAELLDAIVPGQADPAFAPIVFTEFLSLASETAFDPANCRFQRDERVAPRPARTVQEALDRLCPQPQLAIESGDGQHLRAETEAGLPLSVRLTWGSIPLEGQEIEFAIISGDATLGNDVVGTDASGIARARLIGGRDVQRDGGFVAVRARVVDPPPGLTPDAVIFTARFVTGDTVYVSDDICPDAEGERPRSLEVILKHLCEKSGGGGGSDKGILVRRILHFRSGNREPVVAYGEIRFEDLLRGLVIDTDRGFDPGSIKGLPVGKVSMDLPYPPPDSRASVFYGVEGAESVLPFRVETEIAGSFVFDDNFEGITWRPDRQAERWLRRGGDEFMEIMSNFDIRFIEARLELFGNRIFSDTGEEFLWLDGDLFLDPNQTEGVRFRSGDGVRGGTLVMPFRLVS